MIGADTNVLLRIVLRDDAEQLRVAEEALGRALERREAIRIGPVALAEFTWTLSKGRRVPRRELAEVLRGLAETPPFRTFDDAIFETALGAFEAGAADFADCLIAAMDEAAGCRATLTFDRAALRVPGFAHPAEARGE